VDRQAVTSSFRLSAREELRISKSETSVELRIFELFAGPAKVFTPTKRALTLPMGAIGDLISSLQQAQESTTPLAGDGDD
jgi:hypothetical protein